MKIRTVVLLIAGLVLVASVSGCKVIPSPEGAEVDPVRMQEGQYAPYLSVLYKNTLPRVGTGYANTDRDAEKQWW